MRRLFVSFIAILSLSSVAGAQGLRDRISQLFIFGAGEDPLFLGGAVLPAITATVRWHAPLHRTLRFASRQRRSASSQS